MIKQLYGEDQKKADLLSFYWNNPTITLPKLDKDGKPTYNNKTGTPNREEITYKQYIERIEKKLNQDISAWMNGDESAKERIEDNVNLIGDLHINLQKITGYGKK